jgi:hypothetical protein
MLGACQIRDPHVADLVVRPTLQRDHLQRGKARLDQLAFINEPLGRLLGDALDVFTFAHVVLRSIPTRRP